MLHFFLSKHISFNLSYFIELIIRTSNYLGGGGSSFCSSAYCISSTVTLQQGGSLGSVGICASITPVSTTTIPTLQPSAVPTSIPTVLPTFIPSANPTVNPTVKPSSSPTLIPTAIPTTALPTANPTLLPTVNPTFIPSAVPTTSIPTSIPTAPTFTPTSKPSAPTLAPTFAITTFTVTGGVQKYSIPPDASKLNIQLYGAVGTSYAGLAGGNGGYVSAQITIPAGVTTLYIYCGSTSGYNGGGIGSYGGKFL